MLQSFKLWLSITFHFSSPNVYLSYSRGLVNVYYENNRMTAHDLKVYQCQSRLFHPSTESWTIKKAECLRIDALELWCWRRLLRVPWTARRSNQSILKEISPGCSLEGLMLKLKLQYFGHLMQRADSFEKTLMLEGTEGRG